MTGRPAGRQTINVHPDGLRTIYTLRNREWLAWRYANQRRVEAYGRTERQALQALKEKLQHDK